MHAVYDDDLFMNGYVFHYVLAACVSLMLTKESLRDEVFNVK